MLFDIFRRKKKNALDDTSLTEENKQWNKMWDLWANGEIQSPYNELMTYQSEVNNGGHGQYFVNTENTSDLLKEMSGLNSILSDTLKENLKIAYEAHLLLEQDETNEEAEAVLEKCDDVFFQNEKDINAILESFCKQI